MKNILYATNGSGIWYKTVFADQCGEKVFMIGQCQGVHGHNGVHWAFDKSGRFCYSDNESDPSEHGCSGQIPAGHNSYRSPLEMAKHYYMSVFPCHVQITDPDEIARLERNELLEGESITQPINKNNIDKEEFELIMERCKEYDKNFPKRSWWNRFWHKNKPRIT